jgi:hypothetical protein
MVTKLTEGNFRHQIKPQKSKLKPIKNPPAPKINKCDKNFNIFIKLIKNIDSDLN